VTYGALTGHVARLISDSELLINKGRRDGVSVGDVFAVIDDRTTNVKDPITGEDLGSLRRDKVKIKILEVDERLSLGQAMRGGSMFSVGSVLSGTNPRPTLATTYLTPTWPEGVEVRDEVMRVSPTEA
jgi:hypothetical protein